VRTALGDAFGRVWEEGTAMPLDAAIAAAMRDRAIA
jgi:hypothetical protein